MDFVWQLHFDSFWTKSFGRMRLGQHEGPSKGVSGIVVHCSTVVQLPRQAASHYKVCDLGQQELSLRGLWMTNKLG